MTQDMLISKDEQPQIASTNDAARNQLHQFCSLAKTAQGTALLDLVKQVLEAPNIYVFSELLEMPNIQELKNGADIKYYNTLNLFAYGTYKHYRQNVYEFLELTDAMKKKLQHLTIVSLAIKTKSLPYAVIHEALEINNVRHLEDLIIEAIYADIIHGKLFQNSRVLEIDYAQGRDVPPGYTATIAQTLKDWIDSCDAISNCIDEQIQHANLEKAKRLKKKEHIEQELINLKKVLKTQASDSDESMQIDSREPLAGPSSEVRKKPGKIKTPRGAVSGSLKFSK